MVPPDREARFQLIPSGLYYLDAADKERSALLLITVPDNHKYFMRSEYEEAREARRAIHLLGFLSERDFENIVARKCW